MNYLLALGKPAEAMSTGAAGKISGRLADRWNHEPTSQGLQLELGLNNALPLFNSRNLPNVVHGVNPKIGHQQLRSCPRDLYLDIKAFAAPAPFTYGNAPSILNVRAFPSYNEDLPDHEANLYQ